MNHVLIAFSLHTNALIALYLVILVVIGFCFSRHSAETGRTTLRSFPLGASLAISWLSVEQCLHWTGGAYFVGIRWALMALAAWCCLPLVIFLFLPLQRGLPSESLYDFLALRFSHGVKRFAVIYYIVWRLAWAIAMLYLPCRLVQISGVAGDTFWPVVVGLGLTTTVYCLVGGLRAVVWTDIVQMMLLVGGAIGVLLAIGEQNTSGLAGIWEAASRLGRTDLQPAHSPPTPAGWLGYEFLATVTSLAVFLVADQISAQRVRAAKSASGARRSLVLAGLTLTAITPCLVAVGLGMLVYFQTHPQSLRPIWVANAGSDHVLLDWRRDGAALDSGDPLRIQELIDQGQLLRPHVNEPFPAGTRSGDLFAPASRAIAIDRIGQPKVVDAGPTGRSEATVEWIVDERAIDELLPRLLSQPLAWGIALALLALIAAAMSSVDSAVYAIASVTAGESMTVHKRATIAIIGAFTTAATLLVASAESYLVNGLILAQCLGGPLLGTFLLGALTRRTTAAAAILAMLAGAATALGVALAAIASRSAATPAALAVGAGLATTLLVGYLASFAVGERTANDDLRGLVWGIGKLGDRGPETASIAIEIPDDR